MGKLTEKDTPFHSNEEEDKTVQELKEMLSQAPTLVHPQTKGVFVPKIRALVHLGVKC